MHAMYDKSRCQNPEARTPSKSGRDNSGMRIELSRFIAVEEDYLQAICVAAKEMFSAYMQTPFTHCSDSLKQVTWGWAAE